MRNKKSNHHGTDAYCVVQSRPDVAPCTVNYPPKDLRLRMNKRISISMDARDAAGFFSNFLPSLHPANLAMICLLKTDGDVQLQPLPIATTDGVII